MPANNQNGAKRLTLCDKSPAGLQIWSHRIVAAASMLFIVGGIPLSTANTLSTQDMSCKMLAIKCVGVGQEFEIIQDAVESLQPGDQVWIRSGDYKHPKASKLRFITVNSSGTSENPIIIQSYPGEKARILGWGFSDGNEHPKRRGEVLLIINGDHVVVRNLEFSLSTRSAIHVNGDFGRYSNLVVYDNWLEGIVVCRDSYDENDTIGNLFQHIEVSRTRHGTGWLMGPRQKTSGVCDSNTLEKSLFHSNGYQSDGKKVNSVTGDPAGGGNSDGFGLSKECSDSSGSGSNLCTNFTASLNIVWNNADDGIDISPGRGANIRSNIAFNNGPEGNRGIKVLRNTKSDALAFYDNVIFLNGLRGFEIRSESNLKMYHNTAFNHPAHGFILVSPSHSNKNFLLKNNHSFSNGTYDLVPESNNAVGNLWYKNSSQPAFSQDSHLNNFQLKQFGSVEDRWTANYWSIRRALKSFVNPDVIDQGEFIRGFHCDEPDHVLDRAKLADEKCRHWLGLAPDIGAFEIG